MRVYVTDTKEMRDLPLLDPNTGADLLPAYTDSDQGVQIEPKTGVYTMNSERYAYWKDVAETFEKGFRLEATFRELDIDYLNALGAATYVSVTFQDEAHSGLKELYKIAQSKLREFIADEQFSSAIRLIKAGCPKNVEIFKSVLDTQNTDFIRAYLFSGEKDVFPHVGDGEMDFETSENFHDAIDYFLNETPARDFEVVVLLAEAGAEINYRRNGVSLLQYADVMDHPEYLPRLILAGGELYPNTIEEEPILTTAVYEGKTPYVEALLDAGMIQWEKEFLLDMHDDSNPVCAALQSGHEEIFTLLVSRLHVPVNELIEQCAEPFYGPSLETVFKSALQIEGNYRLSHTCDAIKIPEPLKNYRCKVVSILSADGQGADSSPAGIAILQRFDTNGNPMKEFFMERNGHFDRQLIKGEDVDITRSRNERIYVKDALQRDKTNSIAN